ncbi:MAG: GNAT family N-acetyltransferase, partial [Ktedonobacteraceae bacterium]|nr:GNAT family N-acetyltransferase [Ktedonobacteraceae bacterium]
LQEFLNPLQSEQHAQIRLWEDAAGRLLAYANVSLPNCNLSFLIHPAQQQAEILEEVLTYAGEVIRRFNRESGEEHTLDVHCRDSDEQTLQVLLNAGFERQAEKVPVLVRSLDGSLAEPQLPPGFKLRYVTGAQEVEQCVELHRAAFGTQRMTVEIRLSIMQEPDYDPRGDLVIEALDGTFVAYCICQVHPEEKAQSGRNWGYTDPVGVRPEFQRRGLGKAVLQSGLCYLQRRGVEKASFMTSSENTAMLGLGASLGFRNVYSYLWLSKKVSEG